MTGLAGRVDATRAVRMRFPPFEMNEPMDT